MPPFTLEQPMPAASIKLPMPDLMVTEGLSGEVVDDITRTLRRHLAIGQVRTYHRKAFDPELKQYLQLIGDLAFWAPVAIPATAFVTQLAVRSADDAYSAFKSWLSREPECPIAEIAMAISDIRSRNGASASIRIGLNVPDRNWGTALEIEDTDPAKVLLKLALFLNEAGRIHKVISDATAAGDGPLGQGVIAILNHGDIEITWSSQKNFARKTVILSAANDK
jgi:hypothetical protein